MNQATLLFPIQYSVEQLQHDLRTCETSTWTEHFNTRQYVGDWTSIALRSSTGAINDIVSFANQDFRDTPLLSQCPYFQEIIAGFNCEKEAIRLLRLGPHSEIKEHVDNDTSYADGFFRIHIPICTNDRVQFFVNQQLVPMKEGECWYANFQLPHSVKNNSNEARVHLVIDCKRNAWSDQWFAESGFDIHAPRPKQALPDAVKLQVIEQLLRNPTPTNLQLAASLQLEIDTKA